MPDARHRSWCFTKNNYTDIDEAAIRLLECKYLVYGRETAPETGTPHLQGLFQTFFLIIPNVIIGYIVFNNAKTLRSVTALQILGHVEQARGNAAQNREYCTKSNDYFEKGDVPRSGSRTDLEAIKEMVMAGDSMDEIARRSSSFVQLRYAEKLKEHLDVKRDWKPHVKVYYGGTGTGKTSTAHKEMPDAWWSGENLQWWQGYDGHEDVIIDDFRGDFVRFHTLLRILDRYPYTVQVKGGSRQFVAKRIIITSAKHPTEWYYEKSNEDLKQLLRRIDEIKEFI